MNKKFLPSKKFVKTILGIIVLIVIITLIGSISNKKTLFKSTSQQGKVLVVSEAVERDTDGDGLKDWEEALWGLDPKNPDTDGDGLIDSDEIRKIQEFLGAGNENNPDNPANDKTKTGALTRDVLTIAQAINQSGTITKESSEAITDEIAKYLEKQDLEKFTIKDITVVEQATPAQLKTYALNMKKSVERTYLTKEDIQLIADYEKNMDSNMMTPYVQVADKFKKEVGVLKKTSVPEQFIGQHIAYMNSLQHMGTFYNDLALQDIDPARSLAAFVASESIFNEYQKMLEHKYKTALFQQHSSQLQNRILSFHRPY
jgi:hypothetical protein